MIIYTNFILNFIHIYNSSIFSREDVAVMAENQNNNFNSDIVKILEETEAAVYITKMNSFELLYLNSTAKKTCGIGY